MHEYSTEQWVPYTRRLVFAFFANPANLPPLIPQWQKARIDEVDFRPPPPRPQDTPRYLGAAAGDGTRLTITARAFPLLPFRGSWIAEIRDFRWNEAFCDLQLNGPFRYWKHCHSVHDAGHRGAAGTLIRDQVHYALPAEPFTRAGYAAMQLVLRALFHYRQARTAELLPRFAASACPSTIP